MAFVGSTAPPPITRNIIMLLSKIAAATLFVSAAVAHYCTNKTPTQDWALYVYPEIDCDKGNDVIAIDSFSGNLGTSSSNDKSSCLNLKNVGTAKSLIFNARSESYSMYIYSESGCKGGETVVNGPYFTPDGVTENGKPVFSTPPKSFQVVRYD
ncbi:hypothetical protein BV22DRAFT_51199 [Leucogyrophana mollusca]|uniref:Uncharacterized protein n=1 Tax=Leucogyrophana mollusca TaxID=85980 RepID=A0ACB8BYZ6_9AGAM|nr:hypothetical protein BV22DRAFT_51199 [Leucogyrophana mollusca]